MKLIAALVVVVLAAASVEAAPGVWQDPWQQQRNPWQQQSDPWQQQNNLWQPSVQKGHYAHYIDDLQVQKAVPVPPLHPAPLHLAVHDHPNRIHLDVPHVPHPHLIGYEAHEPEVKIVKHGW